MKSIEDIATRIVMEFYGGRVFKKYYQHKGVKKGLKITQSVLKIALRGFMAVSKLGNLNDYLSDVTAIGKNALESTELFICFDDLERKDSSFNLEDLIGYINSLVDEGVKVMIICNEDLLLKGNDDGYKNLKEKTIGITFDFFPAVDTTLRAIVESKYVSYPVYKDLLEAHFDLLQNVAKATEYNFRNVSYGLDVLQECYSRFEASSLAKDPDIGNIFQEQLANIVKFIITMAVEYKSSAFKYEDHFKLESASLTISQIVWGGNKDEDNPEGQSLVGKFIKKYKIQRGEYVFYETLFTFITARADLDTSAFVDEFKTKFHIDKGQIPPHYQALNKLGYGNDTQLSDTEYAAVTNEVISFALKGKYDPANYLSIMHYAERYDNVLGFDLDKLVTDLSIGLKIAVENIQGDFSMTYSQFEMSGETDSLSAFNQELYREGMKIINEQKEKNSGERAKAAVDLFFRDFKGYVKKRNEDNDFSYVVDNQPIFKDVGSDDFIKLLTTAPLDDLELQTRYLAVRYKNSDQVKEEIPMVKEVLAKLQARLKKEEASAKTRRSFILRKRLVEPCLKQLGE
jgi:hypothetical protein